MMEPGFFLLLVGGALLPESGARRSATLAAVSAGLAIAGLRAGQAPAFAPGAAPAGLPAGFVAVDGALVLMAVVLAAGSALAPRAAETRIAAGTLAAGAVALAWGGDDLLTGARAMGLLVSLCGLAGL